jgi:glycosyltransferase involved in cell wall biosynthesis
MIKIIYHLQLSAIDKETKRFVLHKDSNFSVMQNVIKSLNCYYSGQYAHTILAPGDIDAISQDLLNTFDNNVNVIYDNDFYSKSVFSSRYDWNSDRYKSLINDFVKDVNIIWENNPSLVMNWKTLLLEENLLDKVKVITYNHWIDTKEYPKINKRCAYAIRQFEGVLYSDLAMANSGESIKQISDQAYDYFHDELLYDVVKIPPFIYEDEKLIYGRLEDDDKIRIIYNHRLSSLPYYKDGFDTFVQTINNISDKVDKKIQVIFTDASNKLSSKNEIDIKEKDNLEVILLKDLSKQRYYDILRIGDICVACFSKNGGCWSISLMEGILTGNAVLLPNHSGYREMVPMKFVGLCNNDNDYTTKLLDLINNKELRNENSKIAIRYYLKKYSAQRVCETLHNELQKVIR